MEARRVNPRLTTAAIVTVSIGDIDRLDVDALSVNARKLTNRLIRAARARKKDVYAWTVDDPRQMVTLMERGVSNIVTNVPDVLVRLRTEFAGLGDIERRLLAARYLLGLEPELDVADPTAIRRDWRSALIKTRINSHLGARTRVSATPWSRGTWEHRSAAILT